MGLIGGISSWGHGDADGSSVFDFSGRRDYIGGYLRSNFLGSFHRNLHVSAEVELERLAMDDGNQPFYGVVWGLLGGVKTSSPKGGLTTELQAGMRLSLHDKRPNLPFWPVVNLRMGLSF